MKATVTTRDSRTIYGNNPEHVEIIEDANAQELDGDFLFIYKKTPGLLLGSWNYEDRAIFKAADVVKVVFEE